MAVNILSARPAKPTDGKLDHLTAVRKYSVTLTATVKTGAIAAPHVNKSGSGTAARTRLSTNNGLKKKERNIMNAENCRTVASNSLNCAIMYCKSKNFGRAFSHYLIALKLMPAWKSELKESVSTVLYKWGKTLESEERYTDLFKCYEQTLEIFPENEYILNNLGALLLKYGFIQEAAHYFRRSISIRPLYLRALRNIENVANLAVQRWHFRMLNDLKRNTAFCESIKKKISQGFDTVLDIGTGTSILSLFAVQAGAKSIIACDSSSFMTDIARQVTRENKAENIRLLNKHSCDIKIPYDVPERVKLVVTEIVDCGLLGENILQTLTHAWDCLLENSDSSSAVIPFAARLFVAGAEFDSFRMKHYLMENARNDFNFEGCQVVCDDGDYDSENLKAIRSGFKYLTEPYESFIINFNDRECLKKMLGGELDENISLFCSEIGRLDCLVVWFDLYVDEDNEYILSTHPDSESCNSWDQAIFSLPDCFQVARSDEISVKMSFASGKLEFKNFILNPVNQLNSLNSYEHVFNPSEELMKMLNSKSYTESFSEIIEIIEKKEMRGVSIFDHFSFPILGLRLLIKNRDSKNALTCVTRCENDLNLLKFIAKKYDLENQVRFLSDDDVFEMDEKFDIILLTIVDSRGEIRDEVVAHLENIRTCLRQGGLFLPEKVVAVGQLVECEWLERMARVTGDEATLGYGIGKFINIYQVNSHLDFDYKGISKKPLSEPFDLCNVDPCEHSKNFTVPITQNGDVNALVYWFRINFIDGSQIISTLNDGVTNQSALILPKRFVYNSVELSLIYDNGLFIVEIRH